MKLILIIIGIVLSCNFSENAEMSFGAIRIDEIVLCTRSFQDKNTDSLIKHPLSESSRWAGHRVSEYSKKDGSLLVMIQKRGGGRKDYPRRKYHT